MFLRERSTLTMHMSHLNYALYNIWANNRLIRDLLSQDEVLLTQTCQSSFPDIRSTILHIWYAEVGWLSRLEGKGWVTKHVTSFNGTTRELFIAWQKTSEAFHSFVATADLEKKVSFKSKDEVFSIPSREIIHTVFNHGSYHRGQVVTMLRQLGVSDISQTDYIEWVREKERGNA